jgi:hypothetical protein
VADRDRRWAGPGHANSRARLCLWGRVKETVGEKTGEREGGTAQLPITGRSVTRPFIPPSVKGLPVSSRSVLSESARGGGALFVFASVIIKRVEVGLASSVILLFALFDDGTLPVSA